MQAKRHRAYCLSRIVLYGIELTRLKVTKGLCIRLLRVLASLPNSIFLMRELSRTSVCQYRNLCSSKYHITS